MSSSMSDNGYHCGLVTLDYDENHNDSLLLYEMNEIVLKSNLKVNNIRLSA